MALSEVGLESEKERLRTLRDYKLLDTPPEDDFDGFVTVAADFMRAPMAFFSLVDNSRVWFKWRVGSDAEEVSRECSFCGYSAQNDEILIVKDAKRILALQRAHSSVGHLMSVSASVSLSTLRMGTR